MAKAGKDDRKPRRLTDRFIRGLKPKRDEAYAQVFDTSARGLMVRATATGSSFYFVYWRAVAEPGTERVIRKKTFMRVGDIADVGIADARDKVAKFRALIADDKDPLEERRRAEAARLSELRKAEAAQTFEKLATAFVDELRFAGKKSWRNYHRVLIGGPLPEAKRTLKRKRKSAHIPLSVLWADLKIEDIKRSDVRDAIETIKKRAPIHANRTFAYVRQAFNFALDREWIESNPCAGIHKRIRSEERERRRVLGDEEIRKIWKGLDGEAPLIADVVRTLLLTWQRSGEVFRMRWDELDDSGWWTLPESRTKNGLPHRVYLAKPVRDILERRYADQQRTKYADCEWVFRSPKWPKQPLSHIAKAIIRVRAATGIEFRPHDLRRTAASLAAKAGVPELTIPKVLGHIPTGVTRKHYNLYAYDAEKKAALELWSREVDRILKDEERPASDKVVSFFARA